MSLSPAEILVPLENETVVLGDVAHFFCQIQGRYEDLRLRIGRSVKSLDFHDLDIIVTTENGSTVDDDMAFTNITINITASEKHNNTLLECYDVDLGREGSSKATLTIKGMYRKNSYYSVKRYKHCPVPGGPEEPEVGYEVDRDEKEIVLSWPHPFTWEDYPITGYDIVCRETESEKIIHDMTLNDTDILNEPVVSHTVDLPPCVPDCYTLQCTVTASNALDQSNISITDIFFPKSKLSFRSVQ